MEVQHRVGVLVDDLTQRPAQDSARQDAPVCASSDRNGASPDAPNSDRELPDLAAGRELEPVGGGWDGTDPSRNAWRVVLAGVVAEPELGERFVGPRRVACDRERGRSVAEWAFPAELLEELGAALDVAAEVVLALPVNKLVRKAVAGELVTSRRNFADKIRVPLGGHAQDEERGVSAQLVKEREDRFRLPLECRAARVPVRAAEAPVDELVPVLEVEAEQELGHRLELYDRATWGALLQRSSRQRPALR